MTAIAISILILLFKSSYASIYRNEYNVVDNLRNQVYCETIQALSPPFTSTCWTYNSIPDINQYTELQKGCDYKPCEDAVCACDNYCCDISWDLSCRGYEKNGMDVNNNAFIDGCSASLLCCDPEATFTDGTTTSTTGSMTGNENDSSPTDTENEKQSEVTITGVQVVGPQLCNDQRTIGYSTLDELNRDIAMQFSTFSGMSTNTNKVYILCPDTTFDFNEENSSIIPYESNIIIQCGDNGNSENNCVFVGGLNQIVIDESGDSNSTTSNFSLDDLVFKGITMIQSRESSVLIRDVYPTTTISFVDCHWKDNNGNTIVDFMNTDNQRKRRNLSFFNSARYWNELNRKSHLKKVNKKYVRRSLSSIDIEKYPSARHLQGEVQTKSTENGPVNIMFDKCTFSNNNQKLGIVLNIAGNIEFKECKFDSNTVGAVTLGAAKGGSIIIDKRTEFLNNTNSFSTVFIDGASTLTIPKQIRVSNNKSFFCNDIFAEEEGASCLANGGYDGSSCFGFCCDFRLNCYRK